MRCTSFTSMPEREGMRAGVHPATGNRRQKARAAGLPPIRPPQPLVPGFPGTETGRDVILDLEIGEEISVVLGGITALESSRPRRDVNFRPPIRKRDTERIGPCTL